MKARLLVVAAVVSLSTASYAQVAGLSILVDEKGGGGLPFTLAPDPTAPAGPVLTYILPFPVLPGDVLLFNPLDTAGPGGGTPAPQSDLIRFILSDPFVGDAPAMLFYSDNGDLSSEGPPDLADVGLPPFTGAVVISEIGPEGSNGATYVPAAGGPGFSPVVASYTFISDGAAPEPGSLGILALGLGFLVRRRQVAVR